MNHADPGVRDHAQPGPERLLAGLTPEQAQAVTYGTGPLLLLAGPGAGKTRTLTHRAAYLLASGRAKPWEILAVTFSVRAAGELRLRLADLLGETVARGVTAATFHSVCARLLREHAGVFGRTERYTIYDQADMRRVVDWLLSDAERGEIQRALADYGQPASAEVLAEISRAKNSLLTPDDYERSATHPAAPLVAAVWRECERELRRCNAWEFDDLLACAVRLLSEHPHRLTWLRQRWRWLVADEFQDVSHAQAMLVDLLAGPDGNVCVCGDDDQVIYRFRHADPGHILGFEQRHPSSARIVLGRNFRSRAEILEAGVRCVSHNERRAGKALIAMRGPGGRVRVRTFPNEFAEANWVTAQIADALAAGTPPTEILALARTGYATEPLQRALAHAGIPHRVLGSLGLYERTEVRDALAYLTLLQNPLDAQAFRRAIGSPRRGIGAATVTKLVAWARERHGGDLIAASVHAERARRHPRPGCPGPAGRVRRRARADPWRAGRRTLARPCRDRDGDGAGRSGPPLPTRARPHPGPGSPSRRRAGARGPALAVPCRPGLRRARGTSDARRLARSGGRPARAGDRRRHRPADHGVDDSPEQGRGGAGGRAARLRGGAAPVMALDLLA